MRTGNKRHFGGSQASAGVLVSLVSMIELDLDIHFMEPQFFLILKQDTRRALEFLKS